VEDAGFRTGDAFFVFDESLTILSWNPAAEELTGRPAEDVVGRPCWDVLRGGDEDGALVCHAGCSYARLARDGWPVRCHDVVIGTEAGRRRVALSTIALTDTTPKLFLHLMHEVNETPPVEDHVEASGLTPRQREVLYLMADGLPATAIAQRLRIAVTTVRNHIRAILLELDTHSQLEAVAEARRRSLLER